MMELVYETGDKRKKEFLSELYRKYEFCFPKS